MYVTGTSPEAKSGSDYATIAYNIFTGTQLWVRRYSGPASGNNQTTAVAARARGVAAGERGHDAVRVPSHSPFIWRSHRCPPQP